MGWGAILKVIPWYNGRNGEMEERRTMMSSDSVDGTVNFVVLDWRWTKTDLFCLVLYSMLSVDIH